MDNYSKAIRVKNLQPLGALLSDRTPHWAWALFIGVFLAACGAEDRTLANVDRGAERQVLAALDGIALKELAGSPETASRLGLRIEDAGYDYRRALDDRSQAAFERLRLTRLEILESLDDLPQTVNGSPANITIEIVRNVYGDLVDMGEYGHGHVSPGFLKPYVADQLSGAYVDLPDLLINRHPLQTTQDANAFHIRLRAMSDAIRDDLARLNSDAKSGIIPPVSILNLMIAQAETLIATPPEDHLILQTYKRGLASLDDMGTFEKGRYLSDATDVMRADIYPAYRQFIAGLTALEATAPEAPGLWAQPKGLAYYADALRFHTGSPRSPDDVHEDGVRLVGALTDILAGALDEAGAPSGASLGSRLQWLAAQPGQVFPDTEAGRARLLDELEAEIARVEVFLSEIVERPPRSPVSVARVPDYLEASAPGGYYEAAPADGSAPGLFFINLRDISEWPRFSIPTLVFHETIPGHHLESALAIERSRIPLIRQMIWLPTYGEGWALYAEDLADELGLYNGRPLARIGYLQSLLFRAARLVADTGLHARQWSRQEAIDYMVDVTGQSRSAMATEIDRYTVWPGQAATYMIGREEIRRLRRRAEGVLGEAFDLKGFHRAILGKGARSIAMVEADVDDWIDKTL